MSDTHFGYSTVDETAKAERVRGVFDSVAPKYDVMNDLMSLGLHRALEGLRGRRRARAPGRQVLDIAGGTGDLARAFAGPAGARGLVVHSDINESMLRQGRDRLLDRRHRRCRRCSATPRRCRSRPARSISSASPSACAT